MPTVSSALKLARQELNQLHCEHNNKFIPRDRLQEVLSRERVKAVLQEISDTEGSKHLQPNYHLDPDKMLDRILGGYIIVFAILIHLSQEEAIKKFAWCRGLADKKLPFTAEDLQAVESSSELKKAGFLQKQYQFIPAKLKQGSSWRGDFVMPFLEDEKIGSGGFSNVYRIRVYPFYDRLQNDNAWTDLVENTGGKPHVYVRKELHKNENAEFLETFANKNLKAKHTGLIPLLAWYWHGARFNLVFPLADGDLQKFYETRPKPSNPEERLQFLAAISRLSEALAIIHNGESSEPEEGPATRLRIQGYHRDLKPKNILFMADKTGRHHFMISDFGLTRFKQTQADATSGLTFEFGNSTYGAPECVKNERVTRAADVWSLGCIFAEALTFAFRGQDGVHKFMVSRKQNVHTPQRDLFHTGVRTGVKPEIKHEVVSWLDNLAEDGEVFASQFVGVLKKMLSAEPNERPKIGKAIQMLDATIKSERQRLCAGSGWPRATTVTAALQIPSAGTSIMETRSSSQTHGKDDQPSSSLYDHPLISQEGELFGDNPNYEHSTTRGPGLQGNSVPRTPQDSGSILPETNPPSPKLTRDPLRSLERYDTMFVVDCRGKYESPNNGSDSVYSNLARSLEYFVKAAIEHDTDGLDLAFIQEQSIHTVPMYSKLRDVHTVMGKFKEAWDGYVGGDSSDLSTGLDLLLNEYQKKYGEMQVGQKPIKPLNMIVLLAAPVPEEDDFADTVIDYARDFDKAKWSKHQVGIQFVLIGDPKGLEEFIHLDEVAHKEHNVRDMVDATHYEPATDEGDTKKLHKILCGGVNRKFDHVGDHSARTINNLP